jgi:hypothetical protein
VDGVHSKYARRNNAIADDWLTGKEYGAYGA